MSLMRNRLEGMTGFTRLCDADRREMTRAAYFFILAGKAPKFYSVEFGSVPDLSHLRPLQRLWLFRYTRGQTMRGLRGEDD